MSTDPRSGGPTSTGALAHAVRAGVVLVYRSGPRTALAVAGLQLTTSIALAAQVLVGERAVRLLLSDDEASRAAGPLVLLVALNAFSSLCGVLLVQSQRVLGELAQRRAFDHLLDVTTSVPLAEFDQPSFYDRLQRVQTSAVSRPLLLAQGLVAAIGGLLGVVGLLVALIRLEPLLVPVLLSAGLPLAVVQRLTGRRALAFLSAQAPVMRERDYLRRLMVTKDAAKEVRAFALAAPLRARYDAAYDRYLASYGAEARSRSLLGLAGAAATVAVTVAALLLVVALVDRGVLSLAEAAAAVLAVRLLATRVQMLATGLGQVYECALFLTDLSTFLVDARPPVKDTGAEVDLVTLEARDLVFRYPGSDRDAIAGVSLRLAPGQVVALVGENGSGKTTLAKLLGLLYAPTSGQVVWNDRPVTDEADRAWHRTAIATIFQDFARYQLSARDNVALGRAAREHDLEGIESAARAAGADALVARLPAGWDTPLSSAFAGGTELSGGEWQRIALARALFRDAPLVILDEPSAALDPRAEHELFASLRSLLEGRAVLFVSHRFATVRNADRILVLRDGRVVEQGTHDELMALAGQYAELFTLQAAAYLPEPVRAPPRRRGAAAQRGQPSTRR